jgi:two-component system nitrogen regulation response regulator GlnG
VLAENEFFRVGGRELIRVDVRVIAATHQPLERLVADGRFRADLLHRLDVVRLHVPPLRERVADVPALAARFLANAARRLDAISKRPSGETSGKRFAADAQRLLQAHSWPGNVRELENLCWRLAALAPGKSIRAGDVRAALRTIDATQQRDDDWERALGAWTRAALARGDPGVHAEAKSRFEKALLDAALDHTDGHRQQAAEKLGLGRNTVTRKLGSSRKPRPG